MKACAPQAFYFINRIVSHLRGSELAEGCIFLFGADLDEKLGNIYNLLSIHKKILLSRTIEWNEHAVSRNRSIGNLAFYAEGIFRA